jgi:hypothetical protein
MSELGEAVAVGIIDEDEVECPFDHSDEPPTVENDLIGVGTKLAQKMKSGKGTFKYDKYAEAFSPVLNPKDRPDHPFVKKAKCVKIVVEDESGTKHEHLYPVSCAAHHCIPAQESLKESPLLAYMCKKGAGEPLKGGSYTAGVVWADVGYDVNGGHNGIFLPGSYAVSGRSGFWTGKDDGDEDTSEDGPMDAVADVAGADSPMLTGALNEVSFSNRKWLYVNQAVHKCPGQFHDRHVDYSTFVQSVLAKIHANYAQLEQQKIYEGKCPDCKKKADKAKELGAPTPFGLVSRLNKVSSRFMTFLNGNTWRMNIYTSKWGRAYMEARVANNTAVDAGL